MVPGLSGYVILMQAEVGDGKSGIWEGKGYGYIVRRFVVWVVAEQGWQAGKPAIANRERSQSWDERNGYVGKWGNNRSIEHKFANSCEFWDLRKDLVVEFSIGSILG